MADRRTASVQFAFVGGIACAARAGPPGAAVRKPTLARWFLAAAAIGALHAQGPVSVHILDAHSTTAGEVQLVVSVLDDRNLPVKGLDSTDFRVSVEGKHIPSFVAEPVSSGRNPLSVILVMDVSGSMRGKPIEEAKRAAVRFLDQLDKEDRTALITFGSSVRLVADYTTRSAIREQVEKLKASDQWTWLYQAVSEAAEKARKAPTSRVAVVLLTDGKDEGSPLPESEAQELAKSSRTPFYMLGFGPNAAAEFLRTVAGGTGGLFLYTPEAQELPGLYETVVDQLKNQYSLRFPYHEPYGQYKCTVELVKSGNALSAQRAFFHTAPSPSLPSPKENRLGPFVGIGLAAVALGIAMLVLFRVLARSSRKGEPPVVLMEGGEIRSLGAALGGGTEAGTVVVQQGTGEAGLRLMAAGTPVGLPLVDSQRKKQLDHVVITRYDRKRGYRKDTVYLLLADQTVHRPGKNRAGHAWVFRDEETGLYRIQDLGSMDTLVNDRVCPTPTILEDGDRITVGGVTIVYYDHRGGAASFA